MSSDNQLKKYRIGELSYSKHGTPARIIDYVNNKKVLIEFDDAYHYQYYTSYINFVQGHIVNPYDKNVFGVGFIGSGKYNSKHESFNTWYNMISRCYNAHYNIKNQSYKDCIVDEEWHNFQHFAQWYNENKYDCSETLMIDKDILFPSNKIYSPNKCMLVPKTINLLFVNLSGSGELPAGVIFNLERKSYQVFMSQSILSNTRTKYLGSFKDLDKAQECYRNEKIRYIRDVLSNYKSVLPERIYEAIYNYRINKNEGE